MQKQDLRPLQTDKKIPVKSMIGGTPYHLLARFPRITQISERHQQQRPHSTMHYIKTTTGPEACRSRKLAPVKLKAAKAEFNLLLKEGIIQPSKKPMGLTITYGSQKRKYLEIMRRLQKTQY